MSIRYSFDTSAIIGAWRRRFPPDIVPSFWERLDELIEDGSVRSIQEVRSELERKDDDVFRWAKDRDSLFVPVTKDVIESARHVMRQFPALVSQNGRSAADPFVIALARLHGANVVTDEKPATKRGHVAIPNACQGLSVVCHDIFDFVRAERWTFHSRSVRGR